MGKIIKNSIKVIRYAFTLIDKKFKLTEEMKASSGGERIIIKDWESAKRSGDFSTLAHIQRYEWVLPYLKNQYCLDVGCGSGYGTYHLAKNGVSRIIGIDISSKAIKFAKNHYKEKNLEFIPMDALDLKFTNNSFDSVVSFDVLEHINERNQAKFIAEITRVLKSNGTAYISCPNAAVRLGRNPFHQKELMRKELELLLRRYFKEVKIFGQELVIKGARLKENWHKNLSKLSYQNFIITEDCNLTYGLLAIAKKK